LCNAEYPNTRVGLQCSQQTADLIARRYDFV
jgi:hypothetical protein